MNRTPVATRVIAAALSLFALSNCSAADSPGRAPMAIPFDAKTMNEVVANIRQRGIKPGETIYLRLGSLTAPASLHERNPATYMRGREAGNVWANRADNGELTVIVTTLDGGHAGSLGYAYSETPPPQASGQFALAEDAEHSLSCTDAHNKVAEKWWAVWSCEMD